MIMFRFEAPFSWPQSRIIPFSPFGLGHGDGKVFVEQQLPDDLIGIELLGPFDEDLLFHNFREELFSELEEEDSTLSDPANSSLGNDLTTETVHNYS